MPLCVGRVGRIKNDGRWHEELVTFPWGTACPCLYSVSNPRTRARRIRPCSCVPPPCTEDKRPIGGWMSRRHSWPCRFLLVTAPVPHDDFTTFERRLSSKIAGYRGAAGGACGTGHATRISPSPFRFVAPRSRWRVSERREPVLLPGRVRPEAQSEGVASSDVSRHALLGFVHSTRGTGLTDGQNASAVPMLEGPADPGGAARIGERPRPAASGADASPARSRPPTRALHGR